MEHKVDSQRARLSGRLNMHVPIELENQLVMIARQSNTTKSKVARTILLAWLNCDGKLTG